MEWKILSLIWERFFWPDFKCSRKKSGKIIYGHCRLLSSSLKFQVDKLSKEKWLKRSLIRNLKVIKVDKKKLWKKK